MAYFISNKLYTMTLIAQLLIIIQLSCYKNQKVETNDCNQTSCLIMDDLKTYNFSKTVIDTLYNPIDGLYVYKTN